MYTCLLLHCFVLQELRIEPGDVVFVLEEQDHDRKEEMHLVTVKLVCHRKTCVASCDQKIDSLVIVYLLLCYHNTG